jgi:hypothetical protein
MYLIDNKKHEPDIKANLVLSEAFADRGKGKTLIFLRTDGGFYFHARVEPGPVFHYSCED